MTTWKKAASSSRGTSLPSSPSSSLLSSAGGTSEVATGVGCAPSIESGSSVLDWVSGAASTWEEVAAVLAFHAMDTPAMARPMTRCRLSWPPPSAAEKGLHSLRGTELMALQHRYTQSAAMMAEGSSAPWGATGDTPSAVNARMATSVTVMTALLKPQGSAPSGARTAYMTPTPAKQQAKSATQTPRMPARHLKASSSSSRPTHRAFHE
mmetsp:Transcript_26451/g.88637  ORF Transcript_26451/g.88637 Transcript_26451/m.88637 type:complete len:209 (-) Transcript_26451:549-1175(-)